MGESSGIRGNISRLENENKIAQDLLAKAQEYQAEKQNELEKEIKNLANNEKKIKEQKKQLQKISGGGDVIPDCPVCLERMTGQIFSCKNGHGICGTCKPRVRTCATCRDGEYISRSIGMEQMVRAIMQ